MHLEIGNFMENRSPPPELYDQQSLIKRDSTSSCHVWVLKGMGDLLTFQTPSSSSQVNCGWKVAVSDYWFADHAGWSGCPSRQASISILAGAPMEEGWGKHICLVQILGFSWASSKPWASVSPRKESMGSHSSVCPVLALLCRTKNRTLPVTTIFAWLQRLENHGGCF